MTNKLTLQNQPPANSCPECVGMNLRLQYSKSKNIPLYAKISFSTQWKEIALLRMKCLVEFALVEGEMKLELVGCESSDTRFDLAKQFGCTNSTITTTRKLKENEKASQGTSARVGNKKSLFGVEGQSTQETGKERENIVQDMLEDKHCVIIAKGGEVAPSWKFTRKWWINENYIEDHYNELFAHIIVDDAEKAEINATFSVPKKED
ncbi:MAG: hypothetical protein OEZ68_20520 [Gammaproteobacteria bacterium]|nr:hypothetical protein [Gammaproteobacteria bacterium]MDH5803189.1 hypothetical protein [Gammaproteobacteria bacterium]